MAPHHVVTGATGFIGGAVVLELLERVDAPLLCLVRPTRGAPDVDRRLRTALETAARAYAREDLIPVIAERCRAVAADITKPACGVRAAALPAISTVWHAAASLAFEEKRADSILLHNVEGTRAVIALAKAAGATAINHFSTAYVAGRRCGDIPEALPPSDTVSCNAYERTKVLAEYEVASCGLPHRILRPSIVIGHSRTHAATTLTGLYGFMRALIELRREVSRHLGDFLAQRPLRLHADPRTPINFIPVDVVARNAVAVGTAATDNTIFHLANASPPRLEDAMGLIASSVGIRPPRYVDGPRAFTSIDRRVDDRIAFYGSYMRGHKRFDLSHTSAIVGADASDRPLPPALLEPFVRWYLDRRNEPSARAAA